MKTNMKKSWALSLALLGLIGCSKNNNTAPDQGNGGEQDRYFIAAVVGDATYTLAVDDLEMDTVVTTSTALENLSTFTHYAYNGTNAVLAINYQQGNPAPGSVFQLNSSGQLKLTGEFLVQNGFNTVGAFGNYIAAAANSKTLTGSNDGKMGSVVSMIDLNNGNRIEVKSIPTENFVGNRTAAFIGVADAGNSQFLTSLNLSAPAGTTQTVSQDSVFVAKLDADLNVIKIYDDNRLSYSGGQMRSARYSQIANDESGNTYVFSGSYSATTTKKAGALLIKNGADDFDASYYFDIETASGGYRFRKVWNVTSDYFLLEMYNETGAPASQSPATQYAIVKMSTKAFKWIRTGFPAFETIDSTGWPFTANGKAYIPVTTTSEQPAVYVVDPETAIAKKGITVSGVTSIPGLAKLSPQGNL